MCTHNDKNIARQQQKHTQTQQPHLWMFIFHVRQPSYLCSFATSVRDMGGGNRPNFMHISKYYVNVSLIPWLTMTIFMIHNCWLTKTILNLIQHPKLHVELEVPYRMVTYLRTTSPTSQEPWPWLKKKCPNAVPIHLQNHVVWWWTLKCSVSSYATGPSTNDNFNEFLFMSVLIHDKIFKKHHWLWAFGNPWSPNYVFGLPPRDGFWK